MHPDRTIEVLLIEDNEGDIVLTKKAFEQNPNKNRLWICRGGKEGLEFLYKKGDYASAPDPALVLLDLNMPDLNGLEVLKTIKADPNLMQIPVVILTTSDSKDDIQQAYKQSASSYIQKPMELEHFLQVINNLIEYWFKTVKLPGFSSK